MAKKGVAKKFRYQNCALRIANPFSVSFVLFDNCNNAPMPLLAFRSHVVVVPKHVFRFQGQLESVTDAGHVVVAASV